MNRVSELAGEIDLLRMNVVKAKDEVQRLNETFDERAQETLNLIEARMGECRKSMYPRAANCLHLLALQRRYPGDGSEMET